MYKTIAASSLAAVLFVAAGATAAQAKMNVDVHIGVPVVAPAPVVVTPAPVPVDYGYRDPWPEPRQEIYINEPPRFIYAPRLGFHVSVGIPYDIAYVNNGYYLYRGGNWYGAPSYNGPWSMVSYRRLPYALRQHRYEEICHHRDYEYRRYMKDRDGYRGRWYQPVRVDHRMDHRRDRWEDRKERWEERRERREDRRERREAYRDGYWDGRRDDNDGGFWRHRDR